MRNIALLRTQAGSRGNLRRLSIHAEGESAAAHTSPALYFVHAQTVDLEKSGVLGAWYNPFQFVPVSLPFSLWSVPVPFLSGVREKSAKTTRKKQAWAWHSGIGLKRYGTKREGNAGVQTNIFPTGQ